ncbi:DUF493 domain-containing protein [Candidatus Thiothrix sp. Deng01]|uniref:UPF0250 protein VSS37_14250 n=1 Tax=Candidatus Thiothrix phosphatis TaxID=3112415 RepID=A0ABU6CZ83_9GAMM|nr:DUF493 domain-containing protein [Candidatus Thiothrix sp. Deng01]MEB4592149.1 DUF493 domain-containing protein [Candidatus Thiothrix sp. Deng01]
MERFGQREELVLEFPCDFPIKVVGRTALEFHARVCEIVCRHDGSFDPSENMQTRESSAGKYQSLTVNLRATSKEQIDAVYQELKACELVLWAL